MRKLLTYPLCSVKSLSLWISLAIIFFSAIAFSLPLPIGALNDYGNVLDRHGRERVNALISDAKARYGIDVSILASWDNPYDSIDQYAYAILDGWGLGQGNTILAVFLKEGRDWKVRVLGGEQIARTHPGLAAQLEAGVSDLVVHRRVEEAMVALFAVLDSKIHASTAEEAKTKAGTNRALVVVLIIVGVGLAAFAISRRICPRCGHILHRRIRPSFRSYGGEDVVYYCRHCGYARTVTRKRRPRGRGG